MSTAEVEHAGFVFVSHAHFDHLAGVDVIARRTGAIVVGNPETIRVLPSLHSSVWAEGSDDADVGCSATSATSA